MYPKSTLKFISVITLILSISLSFPLYANAVEINGEKLDWENPNKNGASPYKFNASVATDSELLLQVIGCTGVVNRVSGALMGIFQKETESATEKGIEEVAGDITSAGAVEVTSKSAKKESDKQKKILTDTEKREACFNGIAYTLAKNQLTSMTKYAMNWVTTGFSGDPMYVRNITNFTNSIDSTILKTGLDGMLNEKFPYGDIFSKNAISGYKSGAFKNGFNSSLDHLQSTMSSFLLDDPNSYYKKDFIDTAYKTDAERERDFDLNLNEKITEKEALDRFAKDFSVGGWDGWLGLTLNPQNNPLGYTMLASDAISKQQASRNDEISQERLQNNGFLSQRRCLSTAKDKKAVEDEYNYEKLMNSESLLDSMYDSPEDYIAVNYPDGIPCSNEEVVTPGSIIKESVSDYINSPVRQLELADTINESLNSLFTSLIKKFQDKGLSSLASNNTDFGEFDFATYASNKGDIDLSGSESNGYTDKSLNILTDLGNTYYKSNEIPSKEKGYWDASANIELENGQPKIKDSTNRPTLLHKGIGETNTYYLVSNAGKTKLFDGDSGWNKGDRAFFDGKEWQRWPADALKVTTPIKTRGIIQIQQDYIVAAKQALPTLDPIMPAIGKLDYCIPGPNPNWSNNTNETREAYMDYVDGTRVESEVGSSNLSKAAAILGKLPGAGLVKAIFSLGGVTEESVTPVNVFILPPKSGGLIYTNYKNTFKNSENVWDRIFNENANNSLIMTEKNITDTNVAKAENVTNEIEERIGDTRVMVSKMYKEYYDKIIQTYGYSSKMQDEITEYENKDVLNTSYLPMSRDGLKITKDILAYDESVNESKIEYTNSIAEANLNIRKLETIRNSVNKIINQAQIRRKEKMKNDGIDVDSIPPECLSLEELNAIDESDLTYSSEALRCSDGFDNDNDKKVDEDDEDCI